MIASRHDRSASPSDLSRAQVDRWPDDVEWIRYVTVESDVLEIKPALPDLPVVVRPTAPITIMNNRWGRFFFSVPLWIQLISHPPGKPRTMSETPIVELSHTWFGSPIAGDLCYALDSTLDRSPIALDVGLRAVCSVTVRNTAREDLNFERIAVHTEHLKLFSCGKRFWTNEVTVAFRGKEEISTVAYAARPAAEALANERVQHVAGPRLPFDRNLLKRSFDLFREIAGI